MQNNNLEENLNYVVTAILKEKKFFTKAALLRFMNEKQISDQLFFINELRKKLLVIADTENAFWPDYKTPVYDNIHLNLLNLACYWPVNNPLSILPENLFLTAKGYAFDLKFSGHSTQERREDSATQQQFNARDREEVASFFQLPPKRNSSWGGHALAALAGSLSGMMGGTLVFMIVAVVIFTLPVSWAFVGAFVGLALGFCAAVALSGLFQDIKNACHPYVPAKKIPQLDRLKQAENAVQPEVGQSKVSIKSISLPGVVSPEGKREGRPAVVNPFQSESTATKNVLSQYKLPRPTADMTSGPLTMPQAMVGRRV